MLPVRYVGRFAMHLRYKLLTTSFKKRLSYYNFKIAKVAYSNDTNYTMPCFDGEKRNNWQHA